MKPIPIGRPLPGEKFNDWVTRALEEVERWSFDLSQAVPDTDVRSGRILTSSGQWIARQRDITINAPVNGEDVTWFYTPYQLRVSEMRAVLIGSSPSVTVVIRHGPDRNAVGTPLVTGGSTFTSTTTRQSVTTFTNPVIEPGDVWLETTALSGTVNQLALTLIF